MAFPMAARRDTSNLRRGVLHVVLIYAAFASLWILFSDMAVGWLFSNPALLVLASTLKGWVFVAVTTLLLYGLLRRLAGAEEDARSAAFPLRAGLVDWPRWAVYGFAVAVSAAALLICMEIAVAFADRPLLIVLMFPIILAAAVGGAGPGLLATLIVSLGVNYFAIPPLHSFAIAEGHDLVQWSFLIVDGALVGILAELLRRSWQQTAEVLSERTEALNLLAAVADSSEDFIFALDREGRFILFNRASERSSGKTAQEILGCDETALFPPETARRAIDDNRRVIASGVAEIIEEAVSLRAGQRVVLTSKSPLRDKSGRIVGLVGISRDITERKQAENALRRQVELTQRYLDAVQTLMVALDAEGCVTMLNRAGCELLDYTESEVLGRNWFASCLPQPEGMEAIYPVFRRVMAGDLDAAKYFESPILCRDGSQRLIAWNNAYLTDEAGNIVGTLSSGEDITERKQAEEALRKQAGELAGRNAELERFNRASVGRELDMIELKQQVNGLSRELGREPPYPLAFLEDSAKAGRG